MKLVQCQSRLNLKIIEGAHFTHTWPITKGFGLSAFLKVIHTPKTPVKRVFSSNPKINFPIVIFIKSQSGLPINIVYTLMTRINCLKVKKFRKKKIKNQKKKKFKNFFFQFSFLLESISWFCAGLRIVKTSNPKLISIRTF